MAYCPLITAATECDAPVFLTSVDGGSDGPAGSGIGPNGTLVTDSLKLSRSLNETRTLIRLPISASTSWYVGESPLILISAAVLPSTPDPLVGPVVVTEV